MISSRTPIALFAYKRPRHLALALAALERCARLEECHPIIFCDGPRNVDEKRVCEETAVVAREWAAERGGAVVARDANLGLARSIVSGVTQLCAEYGRTIVIEDDMEVGPSFLDYMLKSLTRLEGETAVCQISGFMFPVEHPANPDAFLLPLTTTRGWGTWQRAWRAFDWEARGAVRLADPVIRRRFDLEDAYPYSDLLEQALRGRVDSWGIRWWWSVFHAGGLVLHPRRSLVWVGGFDGTGTNCGHRRDDPGHSREATIDFEFPGEIDFPTSLRADAAAFQRVKDYIRVLRAAPRETTPQVARSNEGFASCPLNS